VRRVVAAAAVAALLLAGCSSKDDTPKDSSSTTRRPSDVTAAPAPADVYPLTGQPVTDAATRSRPGLVVKIDNYAEKSYPQFGIGAADIVVCEGVEGGITRLAVLFHSKDAAVVGPVRSARSSDLHIAGPLGRPLFAYSGTNGNFQELINRSQLIDLSPNKLPGAYRRDGSRPSPYNLFSGTPQFFKGAPANATAPKSLLAFADFDAVADGTPVTKLTLFWKMPDRPTRTDVTWTWNGSAPSRVQNGKATTDAGGPPVTPRNVVLLFVEYPDTGERDQSKSIVPEAKLEGVGEAWVIRDGKLTRGTWTKPGDESPIKLADAQGKSIDLLPGQTWIELPAPGNATVA
jgi:hypothetical protein